MKNKIRVGIIGLGVMGSRYLKKLQDISECEVTALCDNNPQKLTEVKEKGLLDEEIKLFTSSRDLIDSGLCDAVLVVTPHPFHAESSIYAFGKGLHVLCDKPLASAASEAGKIVEAWKKNSKLKFATMYSMRTNPANKIIKEWIEQKKLGKILRVDMVCTKWIRTQAYYDEQTWRGTWKGEGGGLLLNQAPHSLDLLYWWFGDAKSINAEAENRFHNIETEDEVEALIRNKAEFPIRFYASTGEAPGVDRIDIVGSMGTLTKTGGQRKTLKFFSLESDLEKIIYDSPEIAISPDFVEYDIDIPEPVDGEISIFLDFFDAIRKNRNNDTLIVPGDQGIHAVEWANAMLMSSIKKQNINLPFEYAEYDELLDQLKEQKIRI